MYLAREKQEGSGRADVLLVAVIIVGICLGTFLLFSAQIEDMFAQSYGFFD